MSSSTALVLPSFLQTAATLCSRRTSTRFSDSTPVWLDNATVAFLSARPESDSKDAKKALTQIWSVPIDGALAGSGQLTKPKQLSNYTLPVNNFVYNIPSGHLLLDFSVYPNATLTETVARDAVQKTRLDSAQIYNDLPLRFWDTWIGPKYNSLFLAKLSKYQERILDGEPVPLVSADSDGPVQPAEYRFSPDGKEIAFSYQKIDNLDGWKSSSSIVTVRHLSSLPCFGRRRCNGIDIIQSKPGGAAIPTYSPDGRYIVWLQELFDGQKIAHSQIIVYDRTTRQHKEIAKGWDRTPRSLLWTKDSSGLIAVAEDKGHIRAFYIPLEFESVSTSATSTPAAFDLDGDDASTVTLAAEPADAASSSSVVPLTPNGAVVAVEALDASRFLVQHQSSVSPGDLYELTIKTSSISGVTRATSASFERLARQNEDLAAKFGLSHPIETWFKAFNKTLHAFIYLPPGADLSGKVKYPSAMIIHGGPQGSFTESFSFGWNPQLFASHGYITVQFNPTGSTGFGKELTESVDRNWRLPPAEILEGIKHVLNEHHITAPITDDKKVTALGGSYGGYVVNWLNGHVKDDQFACFVNHDGVFSTSGLAYTSDIGYLYDILYNAQPWDPKGRELFDLDDPSLHVAKWNTPTLFIHGGVDYRCTIDQSLAGFTALRRRGIESRFLYFPDESHGVVKPINSIKWLDTILAWLDEHTGHIAA
ncbi:alpha/beta-hydrolase [Ramicandelaber brevisporus]|nr:alpha/beta-hydrolase [Ramicandelaber brevisporus]